MNMSMEECDLGLNNRYAYIVGTTKFKNFHEEYDKKIPEDKSTCNNHNAIKLASMQVGRVWLLPVLQWQSVANMT